MALTANMNRDAKKQPKPFSLHDFTLFAPREDDNEVLGADVAAVAMDLKYAGRCPPLLISMWPQVIASAKPDTKAPSLRAFHTDDEMVWLLAPKFEGRNVRAGLALVRGRITGAITVRDLDRPLATYTIQIPEKPGFGWVETNSLFVAQ
tara:strand:- start:4425 stop:4871 length:447 start_codon:yes stop_codon:yes gene_type:complete